MLAIIYCVINQKNHNILVDFLVENGANVLEKDK